ncbi:MAG: hypothetical protein RLZ12_152 [Bacillota bacterium]|jgi:regulator of replication initiation timing
MRKIIGLTLFLVATAWPAVQAADHLAEPLKSPGSPERPSKSLLLPPTPSSKETFRKLVFEGEPTEAAITNRIELQTAPLESTYTLSNSHNLDNIARNPKKEAVLLSTVIPKLQQKSRKKTKAELIEEIKAIKTQFADLKSKYDKTNKENEQLRLDNAFLKGQVTAYTKTATETFYRGTGSEEFEKEMRKAIETWESKKGKKQHRSNPGSHSSNTKKT